VCISHLPRCKSPAAEKDARAERRLQARSTRCLRFWPSCVSTRWRLIRSSNRIVRPLAAERGRYGLESKSGFAYVCRGSICCCDGILQKYNVADGNKLCMKF
jgi:hypothetical protein